MGHRVFILTNNPLVSQELQGRVDLEYHDVSFLDLLKLVRDQIHQGARLLTHPLSGSIKPAETPYKSVLIEVEPRQYTKTDFDSVELIENAIRVTETFIRNARIQAENFPERVHRDFQLIDLTLIRSALPSAGLEN